MSQILIFVLVLILCPKAGRFLLFFHVNFSRFHRIKTRTYIKKSETQFSPYKCFLYVCEILCLGKILTEISQFKEKKLKNQFSNFLSPHFQTSLPFVT